MRHYEMTNDEIVKYLSGEAVNVGLLENGKNLIKTEQVLKDFTELKNGKQLEKELIATILSELKDKKLKEILATFEANLENLENGLEVKNIGVIDCGKQHLTNIEGLIKVLEATKKDKVAFKMFDNSLKEVSLDQLKKMEIAVILKGQEQYAKKWALLEELQKAENLEELEAIEWK